MTLHPEEREVCVRCLNNWPRTPEYWGLVAASQDGLSTWCKACHAEASRKYYAAKRAER